MSAVRVIEYRAQIAGISSPVECRHNKPLANSPTLANVDKIWPDTSTMIVLVETVPRVMVVARVHGEGGRDDILLSGEESSILTPEMAYRHLLGLTENKLEELERKKVPKDAIDQGQRLMPKMLAPAAGCTIFIGTKIPLWLSVSDLLDMVA